MSQQAQSDQLTTMVREVGAGLLDVTSLPLPDLIGLAEACNAAYRAGTPIVDDAFYDGVIITEITARDPDHPFLQSVETEAESFGERGVRHASPMLSTNKTYTVQAAVKALINPVRSACQEMGIDPAGVRLRITAKLDGMAGMDSGTSLATRGNGLFGADISVAFDRGLVIWGGDQVRGLGAGEIVVPASYFEQALAADFEHPRNFITGAIKADELNALAEAAYAEGMIQFVPYVRLPARECSLDEFPALYDELFEWSARSVDFVTDGAVVEVLHEGVRTHMGATRRHHRWQIAMKANTEFAETSVLQVIAQTGRTGQITPVAEYSPIQLSGAECSRATLHHYGNVRAAGIGPGARIKIVRSGAVIPTLVSVLEPVEPSIPTSCPSCGGSVVWRDDFLFCENTASCPAQLDRKLIHFFATMGNCDGFGAATITALTRNGVRSLVDIFALNDDQLLAMGFGPGVTRNLLRERDRCQQQPVEDWRFLAAFGVNSLGRGSSENLLQHIPLLQLLDADVSQIKAVHGFGDTNSPIIVAGLQAIKAEISALYALGFNLEVTPLLADTGEVNSPIAGKAVVFTGTMTQGSRDEMKKRAKALGATVQSSVNSKTDFLVCGENVGERKTEDAAKLGVTVLTEAQYLALLTGEAANT